MKKQEERGVRGQGPGNVLKLMQGHLDTNRIAARGNSQEVSTYLGPESIRASWVGGLHCRPVLSDGRAVLPPRACKQGQEHKQDSQVSK